MYCYIRDCSVKIGTLHEYLHCLIVIDLSVRTESLLSSINYYILSWWPSVHFELS